MDKTVGKITRGITLLEENSCKGSSIDIEPWKTKPQPQGEDELIHTVGNVDFQTNTDVKFFSQNEVIATETRKNFCRPKIPNPPPFFLMKAGVLY